MNLSTGKPVKAGRDRADSGYISLLFGSSIEHSTTISGPSPSSLASSLYNQQLPFADRSCQVELSGHLGHGGVTSLAFESSAIPRLWAGTDSGLILSYHCYPNSGQMIRLYRINLANAWSPEDVLCLASAGAITSTLATIVAETSYRYIGVPPSACEITDFSVSLGYALVHVFYVEKLLLFIMDDSYSKWNNERSK
ncbi:unnamed protein product [Protopolystoma xenopodis]|uniref:Uncharacterized protein n=1 Tax=Protopolystoma xenopodis TaxID=117903 RepID=A0A3S5CL15_9PLAT|nr:unnamed protein product [Protopolystoma xenopodis]